MKDLFRFKKQTIGMTGNNTQLVFCIPPLNINSRVGFCKTLFLRLLQSLSIRQSLVMHFCQNIICGPVEYSTKRVKQLIIIILLKISEKWNNCARRGFIKKGY